MRGGAVDLEGRGEKSALSLAGLEGAGERREKRERACMSRELEKKNPQPLHQASKAQLCEGRRVRSDNGSTK